MQQINRPDSSYDVVLCNHVLEHVHDHGAALKELMRITKEKGFAQLGVPSPMTLEKTKDWGYPKKTDHGHYQIYGRDINQLFDDLIGVGNWREFIIVDPVTEALDCIFLLCLSRDAVNQIGGLLGKGENQTKCVSGFSQR